MPAEHEHGSHALVIGILTVVAAGAIVDVVLDAPESQLAVGGDRTSSGRTP